MKTFNLQCKLNRRQLQLIMINQRLRATGSPVPSIVYVPVPNVKLTHI